MLQAALPFAMPLLQGLFGKLAGGNQKKYRKQMMKLLDPATLQALQGSLYQQFLNSPAYAQGQRSAFNQGNTLQNQMRSSLAARGLGTSGIGSVAPALAGTAASNQLNQLRTGAYNAAGSQANSLLQRQLEGLMQLGPEQSGGMTGFGQGLGNLGEYLLSQYGQGGGKSKSSGGGYTIDPDPWGINKR